MMYSSENLLYIFGEGKEYVKILGHDINNNKVTNCMGLSPS
jgi:hypothetical protein